MGSCSLNFSLPLEWMKELLVKGGPWPKFFFCWQFATRSIWQRCANTEVCLMGQKAKAAFKWMRNKPERKAVVGKRQEIALLTFVIIANKKSSLKNIYIWVSCFSHMFTCISQFPLKLCNTHTLLWLRELLKCNPWSFGAKGISIVYVYIFFLQIFFKPVAWFWSKQEISFQCLEMLLLKASQCRRNKRISG